MAMNSQHLKPKTKKFSLLRLVVMEVSESLRKQHFTWLQMKKFAAKYSSISTLPFGSELRSKVLEWTREMIDQVLSVEGRYYLPYQIHATEDRFKAAYTGYRKYFDLKKKVDPTYRFRNKPWDHYYR
jgi:hypothetical protein